MSGDSTPPREYSPARPETAPGTRSGPAASVIVPVHDDATRLRSCLESVLESRGVEFEVIVVDDASTDGSADIARALPCRVLALHTNVMSANARNLGARHARGDFLVFFDADETMPKDALRRFVDVLRENPEVDAVVGSLTARTPASGFFSRFKNFQHHFTHQSAEREGATLDSGRMAIRRSAFESLGGFEPSFSAASIEDIALGYRMRRLGRRIRFEPTIQVTHHKPYTLAGMVRSDILHRAIPWTGLMLRERVVRNDLNTRTGNVLSVVLAWLLPPALIVALLGEPLGWVAAALVPLAIAVANAAFLDAARRALGLRFAAGAALFLPFMYLYQGLGLVAGLITHAAGGSVNRTRSAPATDWTLYEPDGSVSTGRSTP